MHVNKLVKIIAIVITLTICQTKSLHGNNTFELSSNGKVEEIEPFLVWRVPIGCDYSGFFVEVLNFLIGLDNITNNDKSNILHLDIGGCSNEFLETLEKREAILIKRLQKNYIERYENPTLQNPDWTNTILIHHKLPQTPFSTFNISNRPKVVIGRVMIESNILTGNEIEYLNNVDYIWVPTSWHEQIYLKYFPPDKLFVINEPMSFRHFLSTRSENIVPSVIASPVPTTFRFLSVFKYEHRKGPDILLNSYWDAFTKGVDDVELIIRSYVPKWLPGTKNLQKIFEKLAKEKFQKSLEELPKVRWVKNSLSRKEMFDLYKSASAFILTTRGEGWCLPCVEAMSMGLPIIVTNYSGPTEYLNKTYSYPILTYEENYNDGTAEPNSSECSELMKHLYNNQLEAKEKGRLAAEYVEEYLSPNIIAKKVLNKVKEYAFERRKAFG